MNRIPTEKFIDNTLSLRRMVDLKDVNTTALNLLLLMIKGRTQKYPTRDALSKALARQYAMISHTGLTGYGSQGLLEFRFRYIRPSYIEEEGYEEAILDLMDQILFHPVLNEESLQDARFLLENRLMAQSHDPDSRALIEALKIAQPDPNASLAIPLQGSLEELSKISLEDVLALYEKIRDLPYEIYYVGNTDPKLDAWLEDHIASGDYYWKPEDLVSLQPVRKARIDLQVSQCSLVQIYRTGIGPNDKRMNALILANSILGLAPMSLLFEEVREKHSLCYSISSTLIRYDGALIVSTGTEVQYVPEVEELIAEQIEALKKGDFSDELLESARLDLLDSLAAQQDSANALISQAFTNHYLMRNATMEQRVRAIQSITRQDVMEAARDLQLLCQVQVSAREKEEVL